MNIELERLLSDLNKIDELIPKEEGSYNPFRVTMTDTKHFWKMYFADNNNQLPSQIYYELGHIENLKEYVKQLDEPYRLKDALCKAIEGYEGALRILEYYKVKEEINGETGACDISKGNESSL